MEFKEIRKIDVSKHTEKKGQFTYLSWVYAVDKLQELDSEASWSYAPNAVFMDDTMMVFCTVKAFGRERTSQLPVTDFKNKPISKPNAFDINTAMQRCLVKAIALHGLGLYIYAGEDIPPESEPEPKITYTQDQLDERQQFTIEISECETAEELSSRCPYERLEELPEGLRPEVNDMIDVRYQQIKNGVQSLPQKWGFNGVGDAGKWLTKMKPVVEGFKNPEQLMDWQKNNQAKINGLDILKAEKYKKDGKAPKERLTDALADKLTQISQAPLAAE